MRPLAETWIALNRLRRRIGKPPEGAQHDARMRWIAQHAPRRTFADVGGLFNIAGAFAFAAEDAGATAVTLLDAGDPHLTAFPAERERRGSSVRFVQGDLHDPVTIDAVGPHDVVWCTGVLYHTPNPVHQLTQLREITRELLYLGTHTIPELPGVPQGCLFYPYLDDEARAALSRPHPNPQGGVGIGVPFDDRPMVGHGNFWWGITPSALRAMLRTARFEVVEERRVRDFPWYTEVVARPIDRAPLVPPPSYYRERAEARERGEPDLPFEDYYS